MPLDLLRCAARWFARYRRAGHKVRRDPADLATVLRRRRDSSQRARRCRLLSVSHDSFGHFLLRQAPEFKNILAPNQTVEIEHHSMLYLLVFITEPDHGLLFGENAVGNGSVDL